MVRERVPRATLAGHIRGTPERRTERLSLRRGAGRRLESGRDVVHGGLHAALSMGDAAKGERHLGPGKRAEDGQVVGVAEVTDTKHFARVIAETHSIRDVELL